MPSSPSPVFRREAPLWGLPSSLKTPRAQLLLWGGLMAAIYLGYLYLFPLIPSINHIGPMLDIEMMLRDRKWVALLYILGLGLAFFSYWRVVRFAHNLSRQDPQAADALRPWVLGIGILCAVILAGLYPITAIDIALYVMHARRWVLFGGSPMLTKPENYPGDPYLPMAGEFADEYTPYGPLWEMLARIPVQLGLTDMAGGVLAMKLISLIAYIGAALLIGWRSRQDSEKFGVSSLTALAFFALNPFVLMQALGNGHNDMTMLALLTLGLVLWQKDQWAWAALALTAASLVKATGLLVLPLFGMAVLAAAPDWPSRIKRALAIGLIFLLASLVAWSSLGPMPRVFEGTYHALFNRIGYSPVSAVRMIVREIIPGPQGSTMPRTLGSLLYLLYYVWLLVRLAQKKISLLEAGFLAFFTQLFLGSTFRIWYPLWMVPFAALSLSSATYWRTFLFSITAELSILSYYLLWRWSIRQWDEVANGPLKPYWNYWAVMTVLTVPWTFGIPLLGPWLLKRKKPEKFNESLWV